MFDLDKYLHDLILSCRTIAISIRHSPLCLNGAKVFLCVYLQSNLRNVTALSPLRRPDRVIIIRFPSREKLDACFPSEEYRQIMHERIDSVDARALIVEE